MATAKERFESQNSTRDQVLQRGRDCADLTVPALMPPEGSDENTRLPTPYQSLGSRGVNNLTSKLRLSLFPPGQPFFRFRPSGDALQIIADQDPNAAAAIESAMQKLENEALDELEQGSDAVILHAALKQLVTVGNCLLHMPADNAARLFRLANFVVVRDASGNWFEIVAREVLARATLTDEQMSLLDAPTGDPEKDAESVTVYTHIRKEEGKAVWNQEINEEIVPGTDGRSNYDDCPYIPLRWAGLENENYGRGHVEEYLGDLRSLEDLSKSLVQMSAAAAKVIFLDRPNSTTDIEAIQGAESGDIIEGNIEDIGVLQVNKFPDFQVAKSQIDDLSLRLSHAFLLTTGTVRNAERVTAEEIRMQAQELEDVLGGVYSVLAAELQQKVVRRLMARLKKKGRMPVLPTGAIKPVIVTGFEALGRGHELNKLRQYFSDGAALFGEAFMGEFNIGMFADVLATQHNVDVTAIKKTEQQKQQEQQQQQQAALADKTAGPIAGQVAKGAADNMSQQ